MPMRISVLELTFRNSVWNKIWSCKIRRPVFFCEAILNLVFRRKPIGIFGGLDVLTATERTHVCKNTYKLKKLNRRFIDRQNCGRSAAICTPRKRSNNSSINIFRSKSVLGRSKTKNDDKFPAKIRYKEELWLFCRIIIRSHWLRASCTDVCVFSCTDACSELKLTPSIDTTTD